MQLPIPISALLALWLNAWIKGSITTTDARNALETLTHQYLDLPTEALYAIALPDRVIVNRHLALAARPDGSWDYRAIENSVGLPDPAYARRHFLETLEAATETLAKLDLVGMRDDIDEALNQLEDMHLPAISGRDSESLNNAVRTLVVARLAKTHASSMSSPSHDKSRMAILNSVDQVCLDVIFAIASTA